MRRLAWSAVVVVGILVPVYTVSAQQFVVDTLAAHPAVATPTSMAFVPDGQGSFLFAERNTGLIRRFTGDRIRAFATLPVASGGEQGLLAIALHPQYPDSPYVYALLTRPSDRANVLMRLRDSAGVGVDKRTLVIVPRLNAAKVHNGGAIRFGKDGKLYVAIGDHFISANAQDSSADNLRGKILRLNPNGSVPADNPYPGTPFWSIGHRNTNGFTWDPQSNAMYATDGGPSCGDEVNYVSAGSNLGWPLDGNCSYAEHSRFSKPLYYFAGQQQGLAGIAVYRGRAFPALDGYLLVAAKASGALWTMKLTAKGDSIVSGLVERLLTYPAGLSAVEIGHEGHIYLLAGQGPGSRILRIRPVAPRFVSRPTLNAKQGELFFYQSEVKGTVPTLALTNAPDGMTLDPNGLLRWRPTNEQALQKAHVVTLRATNGAGTAEQTFTITVENVNDPPQMFALVSPPADTVFSFVASSPNLFCVWNQSFDPDRDTVRYAIQVDTVGTFTGAMREFDAGLNRALQISLPRVNRRYFWRVKATDGVATIYSSERTFSVTYVNAVAEPKTGLNANKDTVASLQQNFPNPFNPSTIIQYTIPKGGRVRLAVFNLLGQEVALIFEGTQSAGTYEVEFNKAGLPTGIYFYRIQAPGFAETRKMIVTK